jgi:hypothetical protein
MFNRYFLKILVIIPESENALSGEMRKVNFARNAIVKFEPDLVTIQWQSL